MHLAVVIGSFYIQILKSLTYTNRRTFFEYSMIVCSHNLYLSHRTPCISLTNTNRNVISKTHIKSSSHHLRGYTVSVHLKSRFDRLPPTAKNGTEENIAVRDWCVQHKKTLLLLGGYQLLTCIWSFHLFSAHPNGSTVALMAITLVQSLSSTRTRLQTDENKKCCYKKRIFFQNRHYWTTEDNPCKEDYTSECPAEILEAKQ